MMTAISPLPPDSVHLVVSLTGLGVAFATKHVLADFLFQTSWMARGKEQPTGWGLPLAAHVLCHGTLTLLIALVAAPSLWWLGVVDAAIHFTVDRGKALVSQRSAWRTDQSQFWWLLGFDQYLHQLTNLGLAATLLLW